MNRKLALPADAAASEKVFAQRANQSRDEKSSCRRHRNPITP
jgi:hypothetical protein